VVDWLEEDLGPSLTDKSKGLLGLLHGRVARLATLIDGILAYSRTSGVKHEREPVEVAALLREVALLVSAPPGVVTIDMPDSMPSLLVQKVPFQQVWMNLIGNALKHGARNGPEVHLGARDAGESWEFFVSDNGPGIPAQVHERIFRIFQTLASRDKVEGSGIGLAIVKKLVDDRGGRVWVESEPGKGAKFCFTWPK
jgi:signal transduction histidine kinase